MMGLHQRDVQPEIMDQANLDAARHDAALQGLARLNYFSGSAGMIWPAIKRLAQQVGLLRVLDLATGAGDVAIRIWHKSRRAGLPVEIAGCDRSHVAVAHAQQRATASGANVRFFVRDVLTADLPDDYDVLMSSLFLHHLTDEDACRLLRRMKNAARRMVLVNDLTRGVLGLGLAGVATRVLTRSPVVHVDGPRSVRAAFTLAEARWLAERAGLHGATVTRRWPFRWLLRWEKKGITSQDDNDSAV
jgi:SAM-dependent methyltransferase